MDIRPNSNSEKFVAKGINISYSHIGENAYIYLEDRKRFLKLNETGSFVWRQINGKNSITDIIELSLQEYEGCEKEITKSILSFIEMLYSEEMIEISSSKFKGVMTSA